LPQFKEVKTPRQPTKTTNKIFFFKKNAKKNKEAQVRPRYAQRVSRMICAENFSPSTLEISVKARGKRGRSRGTHQLPRNNTTKQAGIKRKMGQTVGIGFLALSISKVDKCATQQLSANSEH
jgi:hypothetical protein